MARPKRLFSWQRRYAVALRKQLKKDGVALVQLPTGAGKTAVVLAALAATRDRAPRRIIVGMPRRPRYRPMSCGVRRCDHELMKSVPWLRDICPDYFRLGFRATQVRLGRRIEVVSHRDLMRRGERRLFRYRPGQRYARGFSSSIGRATVVILDEVHRAQGLLRELERYWPLGKPKTLKLILVSATPVNPVRIGDSHSRAELSPRRLDELEDKAIKTGYLRLYRALAAIGRWRDGSMRSLSEAKTLDDVAGALAEIEGKLKPIPRIHEMARHRAPEEPGPRFPSAWIKANIEPIKHAAEKLVRFVDAAGPNGFGIGRANAERFAIAGCLPSTTWKEHIGPLPAINFPGARHSSFHAPYAADRFLSRPGVAQAVAKMEAKLVGLERLLSWHFRAGVKAGRVLVFCRYRRTVWWVSAWLESRRRNWLPPTRHNLPRAQSGLDHLYHQGANRMVWDTETYARHDRRRPGARADAKLIALFGRPLKDLPQGAVLVTSDRLSESVCLHEACGTMVHFDLDWSPLRMMQRVGRLWRHAGFLKADNGGHRWVPAFPKIFHLRYPCSTDDEIFSRLQRRWDRLKKLELGLSYISFMSCLGREVGCWQQKIDQLAESAEALM